MKGVRALVVAAAAAFGLFFVPFDRALGQEAAGGEEGFRFAEDWDEFDGFWYRAGEFSLRLGGRFAVDAVKYSYANERSSGLELDDARIYLDGSYRALRLHLEPDLVGVDTPRNLYEAWAGADLGPALRLAAGQMRVALGSEFATREEDLPLSGYGFTTYLAGRYDSGVRAAGDLLGAGLFYELTATTGHGFGLEGHLRQNPQYSARLVGQPFVWADWGVLAGLFVGLGLAYSPDGDVPIVVANPFESVVFRTGDLDGDSAQWDVLEVGYRTGPFRVAWERVNGSVDNVPIGGGRDLDMDQLTAWSLMAAYNLSGEPQVFESGRWVRSPPADSGWEWLPGQWELAARHSNADIDRALFDYGFTGYDPSTQEVRTFSLDLGWRPDDKTRLLLGWVKTIADHELSTFGGTNRDSSFVLRGELAF